MKEKYLFVIFCVGNFLLSSPPAFSETNIEKIEIGEEKKGVKKTGEEVEEILVLAEKPMKNIPQMSQSATTITREEIEQSTAGSVMEVVKEKTPGVFATQNNVAGYGIGQFMTGQMSIRGIGGSTNSRVLVMVNGRPDFMGLFGHPIPDFYTLDNVEEIEVIRGPSSTLYGNAAMGGVVNITTKRRTTEGFESRIATAGGSYYTQDYMMQHGGKTGQFDYYLTGRYRNSENNRDDADFNAQNYSMRMGYDLDEHFRINFDNLTMSSRFTDPGPITAPRKDNWYKVRIRDGASFDIENNFEKTSGIVKFYGSYGEHLIFDGFNSQDQIVGSYFLQDFKIFEDNTFTVGADVKNYGGEARNQRTNTDYGRHTIQEYAGFLTDEHVLWERLKLFAGLRLQNNSEFGDKLLPQGGISFKVLPELELRSAVSTGYRSPTIAELYFPFPVSAQGLNPETSVNYEFGVRHVPIKKLSYDLVYFYTVIDDTIVTLGQWPNFERTNAGNSTNRGVEVAVDYQAIENRLSFWGNYSYINADELTFATPEHKADIGIHWSYKKLKVSPSAEYVHKLYGADSHNNRLPDFFLLNAKFLYKITKYMDGFMNVDNITDKHYELVTDYPMPGITFFGGISCYF